MHMHLHIVICVHTHTRAVIWMSLLIQNSLVALCSIVIALMFALEWDVCSHVILFAALTPLVIIFGSGANLASVANTISIEKDWVVVLADKNENTLAGEYRDKERTLEIDSPPPSPENFLSAHSE